MPPKIRFKTSSDYSRDGFVAFANGLSDADNPHIPFLQESEHRAWKLGYGQAEDEYGELIRESNACHSFELWEAFVKDKVPGALFKRTERVAGIVFVYAKDRWIGCWNLHANSAQIEKEWMLI